jgi:TRAP-type C4-dicarboxylate transport system permease small subunit
MQERTREFLANFEKWLCYLFLFIITVAVLLQFFSRLLGYPLAWGEEVARYSYVWLAFIGTSYVVLTREHIQINFFVHRLPQKAQKVIQILEHILIILSVVWILPSAFSHSFEQLKNLSPAMEIPTFFLYISFPIGMCLSVVRLVQLVFSDYRSSKQC